MAEYRIRSPGEEDEEINLSKEYGLTYVKEFQHHGVLGQQWGVITRNVGKYYIPKYGHYKEKSDSKNGMRYGSSSTINTILEGIDKATNKSSKSPYQKRYSKKEISKMSNEEINDMINRRRMEATLYSFEHPQKSKASDYFKDRMVSMLIDTGVGASRKALDIQVDKMFKGYTESMNRRERERILNRGDLKDWEKYEKLSRKDLISIEEKAKLDSYKSMFDARAKADMAGQITGESLRKSDSEYDAKLKFRRELNRELNERIASIQAEDPPKPGEASKQERIDALSKEYTKKLNEYGIADDLDKAKYKEDRIDDIREYSNATGGGTRAYYSMLYNAGLANDSQTSAFKTMLEREARDKILKDTSLDVDARRSILESAKLATRSDKREKIEAKYIGKDLSPYNTNSYVDIARRYKELKDAGLNTQVDDDQFETARAYNQYFEKANLVYKAHQGMDAAMDKGFSKATQDEKARLRALANGVVYRSFGSNSPTNTIDKEEMFDATTPGKLGNRYFNWRTDKLEETRDRGNPKPTEEQTPKPNNGKNSKRQKDRKNKK